MKQTMRVVAQTEPQLITKQDGTRIQKCTIVLQEIGGKYDDSFVAVLLGNMSNCKLAQGDIVAVGLRFTHREYNGQYFMDCSVQDIVKLTTARAF